MIYLSGILIFVGSIAMVIGAIMILIEAFKEDTTQGLLSLFVPFYAFYYLFAKYQKENKKTVMILVFGGLGVMIVGYVIGIFQIASALKMSH